MTKCVFLDRDGTVIYDRGYLSGIKGLRLVKGASKAVKKLNKAGFLVIIVSNQSGIARGYFKEDAVTKINTELQYRLNKEGAYIDAFYYCPHFIKGKNKKYVKKCVCRKPSPGLINAAKKDFNINLKKSFVVGDKISDVMLGKKVGAKSILVLTGQGKEELKKTDPKTEPDFIVKSIKEAADKILS
ncbi:MAG: HAD family hydrolase [Armatimonadota bacterium]